jgi:hypothetical protein
LQKGVSFIDLLPTAFLRLFPVPFLNYPKPFSPSSHDSHTVACKANRLAGNSEPPGDSHITQFEPRTQLAQHSLT